LTAVVLADCDNTAYSAAAAAAAAAALAIIYCSTQSSGRTLLSALVVAGAAASFSRQVRPWRLLCFICNRFTLTMSSFLPFSSSSPLFFLFSFCCCPQLPPILAGAMVLSFSIEHQPYFHLNHPVVSSALACFSRAPSVLLSHLARLTTMQRAG
jgi:hypothetical protein